LKTVLSEIQACTICSQYLPLGPRPVVTAHPNSKIAIIGQAPGTKVHETGIPWDDPSGERLRKWLDVDKDAFYDVEKFALIPMGFCYPGKGKSGDLPPRPECAPQWHNALLSPIKDLQLTFLIGSYAQAYYLEKRKKKTLTETVSEWETYLPEFIPLPHPSGRNNIWLKKNSWFEDELVPALRIHVKNALS